jgi:hypothetical protein
MGWNKIDFKETFFAEPADECDFRCENDCDEYISPTIYRFLLFESIMLCEFCYVKLKKHYVNGKDLVEYYLEEYKSWCKKRKHEFSDRDGSG